MGKSKPTSDPLIGGGTTMLELTCSPLIKSQRVIMTLPRFHRHLHKWENHEIGGHYASNNATSVYR